MFQRSKVAEWFAIEEEKGFEMCILLFVFVWILFGCSSFLPPQKPYVDIMNISATALDQGFGLRSGVGPLVLHCALPTAPKEISWDKYREKLSQADQLNVT